MPSTSASPVGVLDGGVKLQYHPLVQHVVPFGVVEVDRSDTVVVRMISYQDSLILRHTVTLSYPECK
jgi:hypothetical protein